MFDSSMVFVVALVISVIMLMCFFISCCVILFNFLHYKKIDANIKDKSEIKKVANYIVQDNTYECDVDNSVFGVKVYYNVKHPQKAINILAEVDDTITYLILGVAFYLVSLFLSSII